MIRSLQLGQFKAFGNVQKIPIKPITLIFGPNSAGKSSIIHSLALMHEAWSHGNLDVRHTDLGGSAIDLGGFKQYVHRGNHSKKVEWSVSLDVPDHDLVQTLKVVWLFGVEVDDLGRAVKESTPEVSRLEVFVNDERLMQFSKRKNGLGIDLIETKHNVITRLFEIARGNVSVSFGDGIIESAMSELIDNFVCDRKTFFPTDLQIQVGKRGTKHNFKREGVRLRFTTIFNDFYRELCGFLASFFESIKYLGPLRYLPQRGFDDTGHKDVNWKSSGSFAWDRVRRDEGIREKVNLWLGSEDRLKTPYELKIDRYVPESDLKDIFLTDDIFEMLKESWEHHEEEPLFDKDLWFEILDNEQPPSLGDLPLGLRRLLELMPEEFSPAQKWSEMAKLVATHEKFVVNRVEAAPWNSEKKREALQRYYNDTEFFSFWDEFTFFDLRKFAVKLFDGDFSVLREELVLIDRSRGNTRVTHRDVGIGISQVLPVLVHAFGSQNNLVAIEQPEIHIHPALQAELGDVFIESALGDQKNTFLIETHSEHLILRILRRIRESTEEELPEGFRKIKPEDVAVLYVEPGEAGAELIEIPIDEEGEFAIPWPHGFFSERAKELF